MDDIEEIVNAKIEGTSIGFDDRGPSFWITVDYGDSGHQGFGGYHLGGEYTDYVLFGILEAVGVDTWEELKGKPVRCAKNEGIIVKIGNYLEDKWFNPKDFKK